MKKTRPLAALIAVVLLVGACGDDSTAVDDNQQIAATARSFAYTPASWTVAAGTDVTLTLTNTSDTDHEWVILKTPVSTEDEFTEDDVYWEIEAGAGETKSESFTPPPPGR
jgi:plastocyanin